MKRLLKRVIKRLAATRIVNRFIENAIASRHGAVLYYTNPARTGVFDLIQQVKSETEMLMNDVEAYQIYTAVKQTQKIGGDIAEVGVYKGASAKLICEAKGEKALHLFDSFEGLPELRPEDNANHCRKGQYTGSFEGVKNYLKKYPNVFFYKGIFPSTADPVKDKNFSFVNLDADLYKSTLDSLEFFYPRMNRGGMIISHDYISPFGVRKAFEEFFKDKPEPVIELLNSQCLVVKM